MAEEKKQPDDKKQARKEDAPEQLEEGKKKSKAKMILLILLIVIFLGGGGAGYFLLTSKNMTFSNKIMQKYFGKKPPEGEQEGGEQKDAKEHKKKELVGPILALEPFVFNMSGNQSKYAKVTLGIELKDPKVMEETKKMVPVIRDKILSIFGAKAPEALMDVSQRNAIKSEVQTSLKTLFKEEDELKAVYITDIIIQ